MAEACDVRATFTSLCEQNGIGYYHNQGIVEVDGDNVDKKEEIDALCDLQFVLSGAKLALGHHENFEKAFDEVQRSNMSKMCHSEKEVEETIKHYKEKDGTIAYAFKKGDGWLILREGDDKVLKNIYYEPAQLEQFVQ